MNIAKDLKLPSVTSPMNVVKAQPNAYPHPESTRASGRNKRFFSYSYWIRIHKHRDIGNLFRASHTLANISSGSQWVHFKCIHTEDKQIQLACFQIRSRIQLSYISVASSIQAPGYKMQFFFFFCILLFYSVKNITLLCISYLRQGWEEWREHDTVKEANFESGDYSDGYEVT